MIYEYVVQRAGIEAVRVRNAVASFTELHETFTVCTVERGSPISYRCNGRTYTRSPRVGMLVGPGDLHADVASSERADYRILRIAPEALASTSLVVAEHEITSATTNDAFLALHLALERGADGATIQRSLDACIGEIVPRCTMPPARRAERKEVRRAREYIDENSSDPITLDEVAASAGMGKWGFVALFRRQVGVPPHQYLVQKRLARARSLLATGRPCGEVAFDVGFFDQSHLNRWFRRAYGITPGEYQRSLRT